MNLLVRAAFLGLMLAVAPLLMAPGSGGCDWCPVGFEAVGSLGQDAVANHTLEGLMSESTYIVEVVPDSGSLDLTVEGPVRDVSCYSLGASEVCEFTTDDESPVTAKLTGTAAVPTNYELYLGET